MTDDVVHETLQDVIKKRDKYEPLSLFRGEKISVEMMCEALPILLAMVGGNPIKVMPFPIFSSKNENGTEVLALMHDEHGITVIPYWEIMANPIDVNFDGKETVH